MNNSLTVGHLGSVCDWSPRKLRGQRFLPKSSSRQWDPYGSKWPHVSMYVFEKTLFDMKFWNRGSVLYTFILYHLAKGQTSLFCLDQAKMCDLLRNGNYLFCLLQHNNPYFFSVVGFQSTERNAPPCTGLRAAFTPVHLISLHHSFSWSKSI